MQDAAKQTSDSDFVDLEEMMGKLVVEGPVPQIYVDGLAGVSFANDMVHMNFFANRTRADWNPDAEAVLVARLSMSIAAYSNLMENLSLLSQNLEEAGYQIALPVEPNGEE